ncbi:chorismate lyase [Vibrio sp. V27_P1S3P104]|uniref:chorismate lyase n=1 Tax=Vibrio TaxID=662 RepID=UPI000C17200C|nr:MULTISPECIES: chorismate lyase [Vibrio]NAW68900.1 chorismate lyase [Vibrio sp. V28_P6S34P95]NAX03837.1 chorismate lyase [Vibrio sp. V30_P3S12P165]NAX35850.1 chorismate lyase [Vibrio sp. V29_P1S30P107]NAX36175.1 chorismate lyase [Vibrio sp. V27_P1S3P104]NAX41833.1 chorismate lyase [Vibrio sp. V26_P1S5P106]
MKRITPLYLSALQQVNWQIPAEFSYPSELARSWLLEQGSLSRLMSQHCQTLQVNLCEHHWADPKQLAIDEIALLSQERCLLRQVILSGDSHPWVLGRTLIPQASLHDQPIDLTLQGNIPLGLTVFRCENVNRDALQVGWAKTSQGQLLARRSRLWMNDKPMLVAELFLPDCPVYTKESV